MGQIKDILTETRDWAQQMRDAASNNCLERAQFTCQTWNLDQMIKIVDTVERAYNWLRDKQR
jgi:hypothetical protein